MVDKNMRYKSFFQNLIDKLRARGFTNARKAQPRHYYSFSAGYGRRARYAACFNQGGKIRAEVYIYSDNRDWNKTLFDRLMEQKESIESELGESLEWERLDHRKASRVCIRRQGSIDDDRKTLEEIENWMIDKLFDFKRVFGVRLEKFFDEERN